MVVFMEPMLTVPMSRSDGECGGVWLRNVEIFESCRRGSESGERVGGGVGRAEGGE